MTKKILIITILVFLSGCIAIVDETANKRKVDALFITRNEVDFMLDKCAETPKEKKKEIYRSKSLKDQDIE